MTPYSVTAQNEWAGLFMASPYVETIAREVSVRIRKRSYSPSPESPARKSEDQWRGGLRATENSAFLLGCLARERKELH